LEVYLREAHIAPQVAGEVLQRRDGLLGSADENICLAHPEQSISTLQNLARNLRRYVRLSKVHFKHYIRDCDVFQDDPRTCVIGVGSNKLVVVVESKRLAHRVQFDKAFERSGRLIAKAVFRPSVFVEASDYLTSIRTGRNRYEE